jgi:hypothetical protein
MRPAYRLFIGGILLLAMFGLAAPALADQITYVSQPDDVYVFLNNIAYARDTITLPGDVTVSLTLPPQTYVDTLIVRENGARVPNYRIRQSNGQPLLEWVTAAGSAARTVTLEYLLTGLSWMPKYDMLLGDDQAETVGFSFFAQFQNQALDLTDVQVHLIAGRVDTTSQVDTISTVTTNQMIAGYEAAPQQAAGIGAATIQYIYEPGRIDSGIGDTVFVQLMGKTLPARRLHVWNASVDNEVKVIYKVRNDSDLPLAEGVVRSYQNGIFIGSDFVEVTPIGSEGSITVGSLQDVRARRAESTQALQTFSDFDTRHRVELTLESFATEAITIEVVDFERPDAVDFAYLMEPQRETGNLLRWVVTLEPGATLTIQHEFTTW